MPPDWMTAAWASVGSIISAAFVAWLTTHLTLRRFRQEHWLGKKSEAYEKVTRDLTSLRLGLPEAADALYQLQRSNPYVTPEEEAALETARRRVREAHEGLQRAQTEAEAFLSPRALEVLKGFLAEAASLKGFLSEDAKWAMLEHPVELKHLSTAAAKAATELQQDMKKQLGGK